MTLRAGKSHERLSHFVVILVPLALQFFVGSVLLFAGLPLPLLLVHLLYLLPFRYLAIHPNHELRTTEKHYIVKPALARPPAFAAEPSCNKQHHDWSQYYECDVS